MLRASYIDDYRYKSSSQKTNLKFSTHCLPFQKPHDITHQISLVIKNCQRELSIQNSTNSARQSQASRTTLIIYSLH